MTQKPEWFEIADNDEQTSDFIKPAKVKNAKSLPIAAAVASAAIIIGGAFFANANSESSASADEENTMSITQTATTPSADPSTTATPTAPGIQNPSATNGSTPSIGQLPQGRGGDDGDDEGFRGDGDGDHQFPADGQRPPHREGGEHHGPRPGSDVNNAPTSSDED